MELPFWLLKIKWAYQEGAMRRRFKEWAAWKIAFALPHQVALFAFVRVHASTGEGPAQDGEYCRAYREWESRAK